MKRKNDHNYTVRVETPHGNQQFGVTINTHNKSDDSIVNELIEGINKQLGSLVQATKVNKPVKTLKLKSNGNTRVNS